MNKIFCCALIIVITSVSLQLGCGLIDSDETFTLTTTASPGEGGTISPPSGTYNKGEQITLQANPSEGWTFVRWEGDIDVSPSSVNLTMIRDYTVVAIFEKREYPLNITIEGHGTVEEEVLTTKSYDHGTLVRLTAVPAEGWRFAGWSGDASGTGSTVVMTVDSEKNVTATFEMHEYPLTIHVEGNGVVQEDVVQPKETQYPYNTVVQLTAIPSDGWQFERWEGDLGGNENPAQITIDHAKSVTAVFSFTEDLVFLEEYAQQEGVVKTNSGLMYRVLREGDGEKPNSDSNVRVHYIANLVAGDVIENTYEQDEPLEFTINQVIEGFAEGVQLMREGAKYELVLPSELGYGNFPPPNSNIHPGATLIFIVELLEII